VINVRELRLTGYGAGRCNQTIYVLSLRHSYIAAVSRGERKLLLSELWIHGTHEVSLPVHFVSKKYYYSDAMMNISRFHAI